MKFKGRFIEAYGQRVTVEAVPPFEEISMEPGVVYDVEMKKHRERRSLDANAFFWVLVAQIAAKLSTTKTEVHDRLLSESLAFCMKDGALDWIVGDFTPNKYKLYKSGDAYYMDSGMSVNLTKPTGEPFMKDGKPKSSRIFWRVKGSHEMDTKEMAHLIDNTVQEAKALGIETMTPEELERIKQEWAAIDQKEKANAESASL